MITIVACLPGVTIIVIIAVAATAVRAGARERLDVPAELARITGEHPVLSDPDPDTPETVPVRTHKVPRARLSGAVWVHLAAYAAMAIAAVLVLASTR